MNARAAASTARTSGLASPFPTAEAPKATAHAAYMTPVIAYGRRRVRTSTITRATPSRPQSQYAGMTSEEPRTVPRTTETTPDPTAPASVARVRCRSGNGSSVGRRSRPVGGTDSAKPVANAPTHPPTMPATDPTPRSMRSRMPAGPAARPGPFVAGRFPIWKPVRVQSSEILSAYGADDLRAAERRVLAHLPDDALNLAAEDPPGRTGSGRSRRRNGSSCVAVCRNARDGQPCRPTVPLRVPYLYQRSGALTSAVVVISTGRRQGRCWRGAAADTRTVYRCQQRENQPG